jgi:hypothetical protein
VRLLPRRRRRKPLHEIARRADAVELRVHVVEQQRERRLALGRRRDDDRVAALERVQDVVRRRRARIRRRRDGGDDADRARDLDEAACRSSLITPTDSRRAGRAEADRLAPVLRDLVGDVAHAGVANRKLGERAVSSGSTMAQAAAVTASSTRPGVHVSNSRCAARARSTSAATASSCALGAGAFKARPHSGLIFAVLMTTSHFASSSFTMRSSSAGVDDVPRRPARAASPYLRIVEHLDECRVELRDGRGGVFAGANAPYQRLDRVVGTPDSAIVGRSGAATLRFELATAIALSLPAFTCCHAAGIDTNAS